MLSNPRFLVIYSSVVTVAFVIAVFYAFRIMRNPQFGVITVRRINVVEPDGTVRLTIPTALIFREAGFIKRNRHAPTVATPLECFL